MTPPMDRAKALKLLEDITRALGEPTTRPRPAAEDFRVDWTGRRVEDNRAKPLELPPYTPTGPALPAGASRLILRDPEARAELRRRRRSRKGPRAKRRRGEGA